MKPLELTRSPNLYSRIIQETMDNPTMIIPGNFGGMQIVQEEAPLLNPLKQRLYDAIRSRAAEHEAESAAMTLRQAKAQQEIDAIRRMSAPISDTIAKNHGVVTPEKLMRLKDASDTLELFPKEAPTYRAMVSERVAHNMKAADIPSKLGPLAMEAQEEAKRRALEAAKPDMMNPDSRLWKDPVQRSIWQLLQLGNGVGQGMRRKYESEK